MKVKANMTIKAKVDNNVVAVKVIDPNYSDHAIEVQMEEGIFKGAYCIVKKEDIVKKKITNRYCIQVNDFNYKTGKWSFKAYKYCETIEECKKFTRHFGYREYRILDRMTKEYFM